MKIIDVEAIIIKQEKIEMIGDGSQDTVLIKVVTDEGIVGYGEVDSSPYVVNSIINAQTSHMVCRGLKEILVGENPLDIERLWYKMYDLSYYYGRRSVGIHAISGIDIALWDIYGKYMKMPIHRLMGGCFRSEIPAYCSVLMPDNEDDIKRIVDRNAHINFKGFKFGWGAFGQNKRKDIQLVEWARKHIGDNRELMIDIGMRWKDVKTAIQTINTLKDYNLLWIEEPFFPDNLESYKRLCSSVDTWISAGEEVGGLYEFKDLIDDCKIDLIQPDMSRCGGLTVGRKVADMAQIRGIPLIPHAFKTGVLMSTSLQLIGAIPNALYLEYYSGETILSKYLIKNHFQIESNGTVKIPTKPGLGIEIDDEIVAKYRIN